jgi:PIN domain nuclease of toxin-antitoxin system
MNEVLADIAKRVLSIESLETRKMDSLDFHDVAVWQVKKALEAAYRAGGASVTTSTK